MQTFLPYPDFQRTAKCLDYKRLGKQRVEAYQILNILTGQTKSKAWRNHPAVRMWKGYERALKEYYNTILYEWIDRGFKNNMSYYTDYEVKDLILPSWFGEENFHASHRSNLLRKNKEYYGPYGWKELDNLSYVWPV